MLEISTVLNLAEQLADPENKTLHEVRENTIEEIVQPQRVKPKTVPPQRVGKPQKQLKWKRGDIKEP